MLRRSAESLVAVYAVLTGCSSEPLVGERSVGNGPLESAGEAGARSFSRGGSESAGGGKAAVAGSGGTPDSADSGAGGDGAANPDSGGSGGTGGVAVLGGTNQVAGSSNGESGDSFAGEPQCVAVSKHTACAGIACGTVDAGCGESHDCGSCGATSACELGQCEVKAECSCAEQRFACGVLVGTGCPVKVDCGGCAEGSVCIGGITPGRTCFVEGYAGSCDPDRVPNPGLACGGYCEKQRPGCRKPYYECGYMYDADGVACPGCNAGPGNEKFQCGPG